MSDKNSPLIGLTTYGREETSEFHLPGVYIDPVRKAGGIPVLIPSGENRLEELCARLDGVILTGGGDVDPHRWGAKKTETTYGVDIERDDTEFQLVRLAIEKKIPTLAICRGIQVLNLFLGGNLHDHIPDVFGEKIRHRAPPRVPIKHNVSIEPGSKLHSIFSKTELEISSWHHQSVKDLASGLVVTARSDDGVVEGAELTDHPWLVAVQWHPELTAADDPPQQQLFNEFAYAAKSFKQSKNNG